MGKSYIYKYKYFKNKSYIYRYKLGNDMLVIG